jgi:hypothetical protein
MISSNPRTEVMDRYGEFGKQVFDFKPHRDRADPVA